jgi:ABC-2 type transport system ATP-binding protein
VNRSPATPPALSAYGLSKGFGDRIAVDGVDLTLHRGHVHGLLGPNGAGKTTVLRMLLGLVRPDAGRIEVEGSEVPYGSPRGRHRLAGFVDAPAFYPYLTASRNLELLSAWDGPRSNARVEELLALVGLADRAQSKVRGFSTGMRQRLGLAAALISEPDLLVVDEPTSGLDPAGVRDLHTLLLTVAATGPSILLSSHDLDEVERLCSDVTVLRTGRVVYSGSLDDLRAQAGARVWTMQTSDNDRAVLAVSSHLGVTVTVGALGALKVTADPDAMDGYVKGLAAYGVAVRELLRDQLPFESLYFQLTEEPTHQVAEQVST